LLQFGKSRAQEEGVDFPAAGTPEFRRLRRNAVDTLVTLAEFEQTGARLGISLRPDEVERRAAGVGEAGEGGEADASDAAPLLARLGLLREKLFAFATRKVRVTAAETGAFYAAHRAAFRRYPHPFATAREQLLAARRNGVATRFFERIQREFAPRVHIDPAG